MQLLALGLNHTTAPLAIRERVAFGPDEVADFVSHLLSRCCESARGGIHEAAVLSTCNRTEIYAAVENIEQARESILSHIVDVKAVERRELEPHIYQFNQEEAARHTFRVASGLDSMVLGETQIVGQMKKAEKMARDCHGLGVMLNHLFQSTFTVAKEVRTATAIGANSVSLAAAAVRLALKLFGTLEKERVLFVGAGEMIELCAAHFAAQKPLSITIANRTLERGQTLARTVHAEAVRLADLPDTISRYDVIVSCTASALPIIGLGMIERAINERRHRPIFIVDLAVPRDVEPEVERLDDVYVYTVDDLGKVVALGNPYIFALRQLEPSLPLHECRAAVLLVIHDVGDFLVAAVTLYDLPGVVGRTVVENDDFKIAPGLCQYRVDAFLQVGSMTVVGYDDRDFCHISEFRVKVTYIF